MSNKLIKLQKDYLQILTDVQQLFIEIEKIARRFWKKTRTEVYNKKRYPQKKSKIKHLKNKKL